MKIENETLQNLIRENNNLYWCFYNLHVITIHSTNKEYRDNYVNKIVKKLDEIGSLNSMLK